MNTPMFLHFSPTDIRFLGTARHDHARAILHLQDNLSSHTAWPDPNGICSFSASRSIDPVHNGLCTSQSDQLLQTATTLQGSSHLAFNKPYPSPPLTGSALRSTIPLPETVGECSTAQLVHTDSGEPQSMSRDILNFQEPLSPPLTHLLSTSELPQTDDDATVNAPDQHPGLGSTSLIFGEGDSRHATVKWRHSHEDIHGDYYSGFPSTQHRSASPSRGWSFEGSLSDLPPVSEDGPSFVPLRADSGFVESLPQRKVSSHTLPDLQEDCGTPQCKFEPSSYWASHSPVTDRPVLLDDHRFVNPAIQLTEYRRDTAFAVSPTQYSQSNSTPSWESLESFSSEQDSDYSPPVSLRPRSLSLNLPDLDDFPSDSTLSFDAPHNRTALFGLDLPETSPRFVRSGLDETCHEDTSDRDVHRIDMMNIDSEPPPESPRPQGLSLPPLDSQSSDTYAATADLPYVTDSWLPQLASPSPLRPFLDLRSSQHEDLCITPIPRSPHSFLTSLPDFNMDDPMDVPPSPSSPLLPLPGGVSEPSEGYIEETVAPSLLSPPPDEGLGLFLQPVSIDPPLARSPSPDDDDLHFLDVQLDPTSSNLEVDEFLQLRAIRRRALNAERQARLAEAEYNEHVSNAANALLPPSSSSSSSGSSSASSDSEVDTPAEPDYDERRLRKRDLHAAIDMRAEARRMRKREKQRSKEVGALLDLKMERGIAPGRGAMRSMAQLVANMVLRRRDTCRPLANRATGALPRPRTPSALVHSLSAEDLFWDIEDEGTDTAADMDMSVDMDRDDMDVDADADTDADADAEEDEENFDDQSSTTSTV